MDNRAIGLLADGGEDERDSASRSVRSATLRECVCGRGSTEMEHHGWLNDSRWQCRQCQSTLIRPFVVLFVRLWNRCVESALVALLNEMFETHVPWFVIDDYTTEATVLQFFLLDHAYSA
jgi:hypothetical protein